MPIGKIRVYFIKTLLDLCTAYLPIRSAVVPTIQSRKFEVDNLKSNLVKCRSYIQVIFNLKSNLVKCHSCIYVILNFFELSTLNLRL